MNGQDRTAVNPRARCDPSFRRLIFSQNMAWARAYGRRIYQVQAQMQSSLVWVMGLPLDAGYPYMYTTRCAGSAEPLRIPKMQNRRRTDSAHSGNHVEHPCALAMSCAT